MSIETMRARIRPDGCATPDRPTRRTGSWPTSTRLRKRRVARGFLYLILLIGGLGMLFPFVWMIASSLKHAQDIYSLSLDPALANPRQLPGGAGEHQLRALVPEQPADRADDDGERRILRFTGGIHAGRIQVSRIVTIIFMLILSTLMVPTEMLVIPWFMLSIELGWTDSYWGIMFPGVISAFGVFLMRQFFSGRAARPDRRGPDRWLHRIPDLLEDRDPAGEAGPRRALHLHLPRQLERLHLAADRGAVGRDADLAGGDRLLLQREPAARST